MILISKEVVLECLSKGKNFFPVLRKYLHISKQELSAILDELVEEGLVFYRKGTNEYYLIKTGKVQIKEAGYGFISVDNEEVDYYASKYELEGVYDGDTVSFFALDEGGNHLEAYIIKIVKRAHTTVIGKYKEVNMCFPGGCSIGERPINLHLKGFEKLGAKIVEKDNHNSAIDYEVN